MRYNADRFKTAADYFQLYFTDNIWTLLVEETNRYRQQCVTRMPAKHKRPWEDVSLEEMKCYIGVIMVMGVVKLPRITSYWSTDTFLHQSGITKIFPLVRFQQISRYLHLADNESAPPRNAPGFDKIYRVRTFLKMLSSNCEQNYTPNKEITVDETMVAHKGRLSYKQYMKAKPTKWGIKVWVLSESPLGYVYKFDVYLGKMVKCRCWKAVTPSSAQPSRYSCAPSSSSLYG